MTAGRPKTFARGFQQVTIQLQPSTMQQVDLLRGNLSRSEFLRSLIERSMSIIDAVPNVMKSEGQ